VRQPALATAATAGRAWARAGTYLTEDVVWFVRLARDVICDNRDSDARELLCLPAVG